MCVVLKALKTAADAEEHWPHGAKFATNGNKKDPATHGHKNAFTKSSRVSLYKRDKMSCKHAVNNHSTNKSGRILRSGYQVIALSALRYI